MAILIIGIFALAIALEATGHVVFRGGYLVKRARSGLIGMHRLWPTR